VDKELSNIRPSLTLANNDFCLAKSDILESSGLFYRSLLRNHVKILKKLIKYR